jgi:phospholipase A1/A2
MIKRICLWLTAAVIAWPLAQAADAPDPMAEAAAAMHECLGKKIDSASPQATVGQLREACTHELAATGVPVVQVRRSLALERLQPEIHGEHNPYLLAAYKQNYLLPYSYVTHQNPLYAQQGLYMNHAEAKFQFSFRFPLTSGKLFVRGDGLDLAYTQKSFWQVYNAQSAPFRETNYDPEIFYTMPLSFHPRGANTALRFGLEHESNGRGIVEQVSFSRSWNRAYAKFIFAKDNYIIALRPWYRFPEGPKSSPTDTSGDDNPDIEKYLGHFDLTAALHYRNYEFSLLARDNLRTGYGAIELGMSFPLHHKVRGYAQFFNGYGESLIDYNHNINRVGIGFLLTDML